MTGDKRRVKRHPKRLKAAFVARGDAGQGAVGFTGDISEGGCFIVATRLPPIGTRVRLQLGDGDKSATFEGVVVRHKPVPAAMQSVARGGFGVRFLPPPELLRDLLPTASATSESPAIRRFEITFDTVEVLREAWQRELKHGGVMVRSTDSVPRDTTVVVSIALPFRGTTLNLPASVIGSVGASPSAGLALSFGDKAALGAKLAPYL